ncbi:MAG: response regulator transcription factor [Cyanophyceae cyanobacterium]
MTRILIAEDEARLAAFMEKGLRRDGYETAIAADGEQAVQMAQSGEFDLLLLDLGLPLKDGWLVLAELEEEQIHLPTIVVTARDIVQEQLSVFRNGVKDYIMKPFRFKDLLARVRLYL